MTIASLGTGVPADDIQSVTDILSVMTAPPAPAPDVTSGPSSPAPRRLASRASRTLAVMGLAAAAMTPALPAMAFQGNPANGPEASGLPGVSGRCAPATDRVFTGTIRGADDLGVNVTVGFDMKDSAGHTIDLATGCAANGYSTIIQLNHDVSAQGQAVGTATVPTHGAPTSVVTDRYTIRGIPANITSTWLETYTRGADGSPCGWSCAGKVDVTKYGQVNRREISVDGGGVDIRLPLSKEAGGTTGAVAVTAVDGAGNAYPVQKSYTWSMANDGSRPDQGWGIGVQDGVGRIRTSSLGSGQDYVTWLYTAKGIFVVKHLPVRDGQTTSYRLNVDGPLTVDLTTQPARTAAMKVMGRQAFPCKASPSGARVTFSCTSAKAAKNSIATLSYYGYGKWIPLHRSQVAGNHTFRLVGTMKYVGTQQWRVDVAGRRNSYQATAV